MTPTAEIRTEVRLYIDDLGDPPLFSDTELDTVLGLVDSSNAAAARLWLMKAARLQSQAGGIKSTTAGQEKYEYENPKDLVAFCQAQAAYYADLAKQEAGVGSSMLIGFDVPELL